MTIRELISKNGQFFDLYMKDLQKPDWNYDASLIFCGNKDVLTITSPELT